MNQVFEAVFQTAWALEPRIYAELQAIVERHASGQRLTPEAIEAVVSAAQEDRPARTGDAQALEGVAVIPIQGVIARHARQVNGISTPRGSSIERMRTQLDAALYDDSIQAILLHIDSPGGSVAGLSEFADDLRAARDLKPIVAYVDGMMASAAYWLGSQASKVISTRSSEVGSIGVYAAVRDASRLYENAGIDTKVVKAGRHKGAGLTGTRLQDEQLDALQRSVDAYKALFVDAVARGRGMDLAAVEALAEGEIWLGEEAKAKGLIDQVGTFRDVARALSEAVAPSESRTVRASQGGVVTTLKKTGADGTPAIASVEDLAAAHPDLVEQIRATARDEGRKAGVEEATKAATEAERKRCSRILRTATASQSALAAKFVAEGTDLDAAQEQLLDDPRRNAAATLAARSDASPEAINGSAPEPKGKDSGKAEDPWQARFDADPHKADFEDLDHYRSYHEAAKAGRVRLNTKGD